METLGETTMRELDSRRADGIEVTLLWEPGNDRVFVDVTDERSGERFRASVDPASALEAFRHPYAYEVGPDHGLEADRAGLST